MASAERGRRVGTAVLAALFAVGISGCGGSGGDDAAIRRAESEVADKQQALNEAQSDLTAKTTAFCTSTATYLTALDRYGDILNATAPTVGDVKDAGADLTDPRADVLASAEDVAAAKEQVATAEKDLAEARAALAGLSSSPPASQSSPASSPSGSPAVPAATVNRVKQADADFAAAQQGITDQTPLAQAAEQFNAAAVALEMSWLKLLAQAGCLTGEQQKKAEAAVRDYTTALQKSLADAGYYRDEVDGVYGPSTVDAVKVLQEKNGLPVTGTMDKATQAALQDELAAKGGEAAEQAVASTAAVQQTLKLAGYWTGPVDGTWTPALTEALTSFQKDLGVEPTGEVDAATIAAAEEALAKASEPQPSVTPSSG